MKQPSVFKSKSSWTLREFSNYLSKGDVLTIVDYPVLWASGQDNAKNPLKYMIKLPYKLIIENWYLFNNVYCITDTNGYGWDFTSLLNSYSIDWSNSNLQAITETPIRILISYY